jgi:bifunctional enzyme CysN/CysC
VLAVNKMDLVDYDQACSTPSSPTMRPSPPSIGIESSPPCRSRASRATTSRPTAKHAVVRRPTLIEHLETVELDNTADAGKPFRLPVQWVNRPNLDFRGFPA